ncbi:hypothetical protein [Brucella anthropi]|jgi:muramidase (phage lysozyme)|uniref:hypothetical protein n=1 Tax=Brucella anthropi TaxID=529 RepID=UPI00124F48AB|nr:hypothetical protein [Brucella anthropi]KAB2748056.1 glycoside hydrolase family 104 protein [Brucella anthropi]
MDRTVPAGAALLLDFVYRTDAGKAPPEAYTVIFGNRQNRLAKPVTRMTIGELVDAQKNWGSKQWVKAHWGYNTASSAAGAAQFMRATLQDLSRDLGLRGTQLFDENLQDRLGFHLLKRRGYEEYVAGKITRTEFGRRLAQEWASLPVLAATKGAHRNLKRGESYYAGDELNKSLVSPAKVEAVLNKVKTAGSVHPVVVVPEVVTVEKSVVADPGELGTKPSKSKTVWTWAGAGIMSAISGAGSFLGGLDWRVQLLFSAAIIGFAIYGIKRRADLFKAVKDLRAELD